jgi:hypothetical protein
MLNNIKATIFKYFELSWPSRIQLKSWLTVSKSFNDFDAENFNSPTLRIAKATNEQGKPVVFVPFETVFLLSAYAVSPQATPIEAQRAGDEIDREIAVQAQRNGISKMLLVLPRDSPALPKGEWREVRVYERKIPNAVNLHGVGCSTPSLPQYIN